MPPGKMFRWAVLTSLSGQGMKIGEIELLHGRSYPGDESQNSFREQSVWHNKRSLDLHVAELLKLDPDILLGSQRQSSDFASKVSAQVSFLRKKGHIIDWNAGSRFGIWRMTDADGQSGIDAGTLEGVTATITVPPVAVPPTTSAGLPSNFLSILTHGVKDNTYKFALARALIEFCREQRRGERDLEVPYTYLAEKFLRYYWFQACILRIRQNFKPNMPPRIITIINEIFDDGAPGSFDRLDPARVQKAKQKILKNVFGHARSKTSLVVPRFQKIRVGRESMEVQSFYEYDDDRQLLVLKPDAFDFLRDNHAMLTKVVILEWTKLLERINPSLPKLAAKLETNASAVKRRSLAEYRKLFLPYDNHCFYCRSILEPGFIDVDHVIPWSYIYDDNAWNLVLACNECNCKKSDSLPYDEFWNALISRNYRHYGEIKKLKESLDLLSRGRGWEPEVENYYTQCLEYGFGKIRLP